MAAQQMQDNKPLFRDLRGEEVNVGNLEATEIESLCMNCHQNGSTRLLLTKIPMFKEIVISSFTCPHCNYDDTAVQPATAIQDFGVRFTLTVKNTKDLNRQIVKSDSATVLIPDVEFEIASGQKGLLTTVEGVLQRAIEGLQQEQPVRRVMQPDVASKIDQFIERLHLLLSVDQPFTVVLDDPCGNSFIENLCAPSDDPQLIVESYQRSHEQDIMLGIQSAQTKSEITENTPTELTTTTTTTTLPPPSSSSKTTTTTLPPPSSSSTTTTTTLPQLLSSSTTTATTATTDSLQKVEVEDNSSDDLEDEILMFPTNCSHCTSPCETRMKTVKIPFFKEVIVMATSCDACGYRSNEIKSGSGISETGTKITLHLTDASDLSRDILKADTATLVIPELEFEVTSGTLGGRFTTIEGLLSAIIDQMKNAFPFAFGDSSSDDDHLKLKKSVMDLEKVKRGEMLDIHVILDDPAGNSYVQNVYAPEEDPEMKVDHYHRTREQDEELGIDQMKVD